MRSPVVAPLTRGLIGLPLVLLTTRTDKFFAWTIVPNMTAAFLGASVVEDLDVLEDRAGGLDPGASAGGRAVRPASEPRMTRRRRC